MMLRVHPNICSAEFEDIMYRELLSTLPQLPTYIPHHYEQSTAYNSQMHSLRLSIREAVPLVIGPLLCTLHSLFHSHTIISFSISCLCRSKLLPGPIGLCPGNGIRAVLRSFAMYPALHLHTVCFCHRNMCSCLLNSCVC